MASSCDSRSYTNSGRRVLSLSGTIFNVDVLQCSEVFRAVSEERLVNQRLHLGRDKVSDWLDAQRSTALA
ncbi:hypothetical protein TNCV_41581 [Trichonephila clavipes]|nr:hypothetical protein TNCV_41581 [Trichonephila clavipes]